MNYKTITYKTNNDTNIEVIINKDDNSMWLDKKSISLLYEVDRTWIQRTINTFYKEKIHKKGATSVKYALVRLEGNRSVLRNVDVYNLDIILSIGTKLNSNNGLLLKQYIDEQLQNQIIPTESNKIRFIDGELSLDVQLDETNQTVWLNQNQIALLFDTTRQNIGSHINNIFDENELDFSSVSKDFLHTASDGKTYSVEFYNLDMILAIGYRVKGKRAIQFRRWTTSVLKQIMINGYVIDENRVKLLEENYVNLVKDVRQLQIDMNKVKEQPAIPKEKIIYENTVFDASMFIKELCLTAKETIVLIDSYTDAKTLDTLKNKRKDVILYLITSSKKSKISETDIERFIKQYGDLVIFHHDSYHDRYLIIDDKDFYHLGASVNYLGTGFSQISKQIDEDIIELLRKRVRSYVDI